MASCKYSNKGGCELVRVSSGRETEEIECLDNMPPLKNQEIVVKNL